MSKKAPQSEPIPKPSPSGVGIKNLGKAISNIKKDVAYDLSHGLKSKVDLEKEKKEKENRLKEALHDREDADKNIKELIDEVIAQKTTIAHLEDILHTTNSRVELLSHELEVEKEEKVRENTQRLHFEEQLDQEKNKNKELENQLQQETEAKTTEMSHRSQLEKQLLNEQHKLEGVTQTLILEQQDKNKEMQERREVEKEKMKEQEIRENTEILLKQANQQIDELQTQVEALKTILGSEKETGERLKYEREEYQRTNEVLAEQTKQAEAEKRAVHLELGNTASLLQEANIHKTKLEETLLREKTRSQEKSTDLMRVEADVRKFKEELERVNKEKTDLEAKVYEETQKREELEIEVSDLKEEVEEFRNDKDETSILKLEERAMILEEKLQNAEDTLEEERTNKSTEIKEVMAKAIHQRMDIEEQLQSEKQHVARLELELERAREELKAELETRQNGDASESELKSANDQLKLQTLDANSKVAKLQHERDALAAESKHANEGLTKLGDKFNKLKVEFDANAQQNEEEKRREGKRCVGLEQELKEVGKALERERKEGEKRGTELEKERKRAERMETEMSKAKVEWDTQEKTSNEMITRLREDNARLEKEIEKNSESQNNIKEHSLEEQKHTVTENGGDVSFWQKKSDNLQAALDLTTKNNVHLQNQVVSTEEQHIKLMEQIKSFAGEIDEIMAVKISQAKKIKKQQEEIETLHQKLKQQENKISISKPSMSNVSKFLSHLVDDI